MTSVGGHSALRGTVCTRAECPGGHCALGQIVQGDILHGGTSCLQHWDPHLRKEIQALENVQKFALRACSKSWSSNYDTLLDTLCIQTLSDHREILKLCLLFNILTGRVIYHSCPITVKDSPYTTRYRNTIQLVVRTQSSH